MPWKDDSKTDPKPKPGGDRGPKIGPWEAPGAAVAPPPKSGSAPRPWDDGGPDAAEPTAKRPRLAALRRPRPPADRSDRVSRPTRARRDLKTDAPPRRALDLGQLRSRLTRTVADRVGGAQGRRLRLAMAAGLALGLFCGWAASGLYRVAPDQAGVVQRFGAFVAMTGPGVHYHLPWPLEQARRVPVGAPRADGSGAELDASAPMVAADGAPVQVSYSLSWRVTDPRAYLFHIADAPDLLRQAGEGAVRRAVGGTALNALLAGDRTAVDAAAAANLQQALDRLGAGVRVGQVDLRGVDPADAAEGAARDDASALQDARPQEADAAAYRDRVTAQARGDAAKALQEAKGVADQEIAEAKGEADRFTALDAAYRQFPGPTRERLYSETMERVLKAADKVVVDAPKGSTIVLPGSVVPHIYATPATPPAQPTAPPAASTPPAGDSASGNPA